MTRRPHDPTTPAPAPARRRKIRAASAAGLALVAVVGFARWFAPIWDGTPYPVADPAATARELEGHTQSAYAALGLPRAELADWPGAGLAADGHDCHLRGMRHWSERGIAYPPQAPGVVTVSDTWGLRGVPRAEAEPALERVRKALTQQGWKVTDYANSPTSTKPSCASNSPAPAGPSRSRRTPATASKSPRTPTAPATRRAPR